MDASFRKHRSLQARHELRKHGEAHGKTLGIIGYGHVGEQIALRAGAFGMR